MILDCTTSDYTFGCSPFPNLTRIAYRAAMARKGGKGVKAKVPAGCSGQYRPYTSALKMEKLRREYEKGQARAVAPNEAENDNDMQGTSDSRDSRKGMELRSRPVRHSPNAPNKTSAKYKLDSLEEINASPEQGKRGDIHRSSTAGNGRRVSAGPSRRNSSASAAPSSERDARIGLEEDEHDAVDSDMMAPLSAPHSASGRAQYNAAASPQENLAFKRAAHAHDSDDLLSRKRRKCSSPNPSDSGSPKNSTPQSLSRLSLGGTAATEPVSRRLDPYPDFGFSGNGEIENGSANLRSDALQTQNMRSHPIPAESGLPSRDVNTPFERLLTSLRSDILKKLKEAEETQAAQLRRLDVKFSEVMQGIRTQIQDLTGIVQSRTGGNAITTSGAQTKTPLAEWELKLDEMTPLKKEVFTPSVFARVLGYNLPLCVTQICAGSPGLGERDPHSRNIVDMASDSLATLLFSLKPNDSRDKNSEGSGKRHSDFKFSVIQNTFYNVQKNTFLQFKMSGTRHDEDTVRSAEQQGLLTQPLWLKPGFVTSTTILAARSFLENKQQAKRDKVKEAPSRNDIAMHGAVKAYRYLTSHLHDGREKVKSMFFQDLGYLLVDWAGLTTDVDQADLSLHWEDSSSEANDAMDVYFELRNVPETLVARGGGSITAADTHNKDLMNDWYKRSKEMVLIAEHEVYVINGDSTRNKQRKHSGGQKRPIRKSIHMLEVAANFCREFTQLQDVWAFLRSHPDSLRCIYAIAIVFREMTLQFLSKANLPAGRIPFPSDVVVAQICLVQLLPGKGSRASLMASRCVRMVQSEYETMNQPDINTYTRDSTAEPDDGVDIGAEIQASAAMGVAAL